MFKFFTTKRWLLWAWLGAIVIISLIGGSVWIDVMINEWFGEFYDMIQVALGTPHAVTIAQYMLSLLVFGKLALVWMAIGLLSSFLTSHFLFRWRTSMVEWYHSVYHHARDIEGASQRVQEDTVKFSRLVEDLGSNLIESVLMILVYLPILLGLAAGIPILFFGTWQYGLIASAIIWAVGGTFVLVGLAWLLRLVGIEYDIQKKEAAYRKILVIAEDDVTIRPKTFAELFDDVRTIHYQSFTRYLVFNIGKLAYLQANVLIGYILLAPAIVAGYMTLGLMQQVIRAFGRVEGSLQYLFKSWPKIIELVSVYKRLREFEKEIKEKMP